MISTDANVTKTAAGLNTADEASNTWEAAGLIFATPQTIGTVTLINGALNKAVKELQCSGRSRSGASSCVPAPHSLTRCGVQSGERIHGSGICWLGHRCSGAPVLRT